MLADENQLEALARLNYHPRDVSALASLLAQDGVQAQAVTSAEVGAPTAVDDDADGLTNTEELVGNRCSNPDSDGDGVQDGAEVDALLAWLHNESGQEASRQAAVPGWPDATHDADFDGRAGPGGDLGAGAQHQPRIHDRDKFDDFGQELLGLTRWDWGALAGGGHGYVFAEMPAWVEAPGDHPLVGHS